MRLLHVFRAVAGGLENVILAERTSGVHVEPLVYTGAVKMVATREFPQLNSVLIRRKAYATFLQLQWSKLRSRSVHLKSCY